jgi:glycosyltransferase involved in cell wall biosynthesis
MVSVIIPLFNVEPYILRCLTTLENQSYRDFEIIIVNDGSTDHSLQIVEKFMIDSQSVIKIINQANQGVSKARNVGIEHAKGAYFCFVDADDIVAPNYLKAMLEAFERHKCDVCICNHFTISDECDAPDFPGSIKAYGKLLNKSEALHSLLFGNIRAGIWALMTNRKIMSDLRFAEGYRYSEDLEMVWKIIATADRTVIIDHPLYGYRLRSGSAMSKVDNRRLDGLRLFEALSEFIADRAPDFKEVYQKFGVARWVWATLWQEAAAAKDFKDFCERAEKYDANNHLKHLLSYPKLKVKLTSMVYLISKRCYFLGMSLAGKKRRAFS